MDRRDYDAVVVGSGPNGLAAAIRLQQAGLSVLVLEGKNTIGGGARSAELTVPGFMHDVCSGIHPLAVESPFFKTLPLDQYGLEYVVPPIAAAHPFDDKKVCTLQLSLKETATALAVDGDRYRKLIGPLLDTWPDFVDNILGPLRFPKHPFALAQFGLKALPSACWSSNMFRTAAARGLWAGMAAHSMQPLTNAATSAIALVLILTGHLNGWPFPRGGAGKIVDALASLFTARGGKIETGIHVRKMEQLPGCHAVMFDVTPRQLLEIAGHRFSELYQRQLNRYRYGVGVFKVDWALDTPAPFDAEACRRAGTVHLGGTFEEIAVAEEMIWRGKCPERPFVLYAQHSVFDDSRAPAGKHTAWAYCHTPHGATVDMTEAIERQVERFAPGFRERIIARHTMDAMAMEAYNANYIGGDINGGVNDIRQLFTRPALRWSPYRTSAKGIYICSSSTPPGGGVHGMCGLHAADRALKDIFRVQIKN